MHYKNGREAKNGDTIIMLPEPNGIPIVGILYGAVAGNDQCNGYIAKVQPGNDHYANLSECLHIDDVKAALIQPQAKSAGQEIKEAAPE
jgi:hypothetical protein